jgi:hypothetical protein
MGMTGIDTMLKLKRFFPMDNPRYQNYYIHIRCLSTLKERLENELEGLLIF